MMLNKFKTFSKISQAILINNFLIAFAITFVNPYFLISIERDLKISAPTGSLIILIGMGVGTLFSYIFTVKSKKVVLTALKAHTLLAASLIIFGGGYRLHSGVLLFLLVVIFYISFRLGLMLATNCNRILHLATNDSGNVGSVFALRNTITAAGSILGPLVAGVIYTYYGYDTLILLAGVVFLITTIVYYWIYRTHSNEILQEEGQKKDRVSLLSSDLLLIISFTLIGVFSGQIFSYIPIVLQKNFENFTFLISLIYSVNAAILIIGSIPINAFLSRHLSAEKRLYASIFLYGLGYILFSAFSRQVDAFLIFIVLTSIAELLFTVASMEIFKSRSETTRQINLVISKYTLSSSIVGVGVGQYLGSILTQSPSSLWPIVLWISVGGMAFFTYKIGMEVT